MDKREIVRRRVRFFRAWPRAAALVFTILVLAPPLPAQGPPAALVVTTPVRSESITEQVEFLGTVRPILDSLVASEVEGRVSRRMVERGDWVKKGDHLIRLDSSRLETELARARADRAETDARLALARRQEVRARDLHDEKVLASGLYDERVAERKALEGRLAAIQARVATILHDLDMATIKAPFGGVITELHCEVGEWIARGAAVVRMADLDTVEVRLDVPERYFPQMEPGEDAPIMLEALPDLKLDSRIFSLVPQADEDSRTFPVLVRAKNPGHRVGSGMLARVRLAVSTGREALLVPKDAIVRQAQQSVVYVVNGDDTVRAVGVRTRRADGTRVEISGDVKAGDRVVVKGNERLAPGQKVRTEGGEAAAPAGS